MREALVTMSVICCPCWRKWGYLGSEGDVDDERMLKMLFDRKFVYPLRDPQDK